MLHAPIACQFEPKRENRRTSSPPDRWTGSLLRTSGIEAKPEDGIAAWLWVKTDSPTCKVKLHGVVAPGSDPFPCGSGYGSRERCPKLLTCHGKL